MGFVLSYVLSGVGEILFGIATLRARVYPRTPAVLLIVGVMPIVVGSFLSLTLGRRGLGRSSSWIGRSPLQGEGRRSPAARASEVSIESGFRLS